MSDNKYDNTLIEKQITKIEDQISLDVLNHHTPTQEANSPKLRLSPTSSNSGPLEDIIYKLASSRSGKLTQQINTDLILINKDKLELILRDHQEILNKNSNWIAPFSIFISTLVTLISADFNLDGIPFIEPSFIQALFTLVCFLSLVSLIKRIYYKIVNRKKSSIQFLLNEIMKQD